MTYKNIVKKAKLGDYYSRLTLVYDVHLEWLMHYVAKLGEGKMVETGVARGGCIALCHYANPSLKIIGMDSWEPMPDITNRDDAAKCSPWVNTLTSGKMEQVYDSYKSLGASSKNLTLIKGWLEDTIPKNLNLLNDLDVLRIDTDFYESIIFTLRQLYPKVKDGGLIILDDWHFNPKGVRGALNDYFREQQLDHKISIHTKGAGPAYFFKK
jgi:O-methyltransferase/8-demethyl-8-(2,3-dimethoxy-alpha-L-rhamnosyl)tetracenomycin-C 4'-O-methyltransferase